MQEDPFFDTKVSYSKVNKVRGHLLNKHAILEIGLLSASFCFVSLWYFFLSGFLSRTFTNHRTGGEGGEHFFNPSLALPPASQTLRH